MQARIVTKQFPTVINFTVAVQIPYQQAIRRGNPAG